MDCVGLALEWETNGEIRARMRDEKRLLQYAAQEKFCKPNRKNAVSNKHILLPVLRRLGKTPSFRLPHLHDMTAEVTTLFDKCGLVVGEQGPYKASMEIKRLAGFVKRRASRKEVTKEQG